nr:hypothetical protein Iba_chr13aCG4720 [Ipomoea batatas]GME15110.1 hypothetical protein Iba_scaffold15896CG0010 [Ipomoea batatas]
MAPCHIDCEASADDNHGRRLLATSTAISIVKSGRRVPKTFAQSDNGDFIFITLCKLVHHRKPPRTVARRPSFKARRCYVAAVATLLLLYSGKRGGRKFFDGRETNCRRHCRSSLPFTGIILLAALTKGEARKPAYFAHPRLRGLELIRRFLDPSCPQLPQGANMAQIRKKIAHLFPSLKMWVTRVLSTCLSSTLQYNPRVTILLPDPHQNSLSSPL